ncbi:Phage replication initiation protein [Cardiobacterium hominis]|uniref:Phage replication initiation protein n=1 Tax=Cardiobacterium hominis TaxID=2718 RepID=A0A1C3H445_9GAMM|nr:hypothetical protein [Cardiobacterium hominis]SAM63709.1 Phage replication initiation protein [Cardiobacterium hominis]
MIQRTPRRNNFTTIGNGIFMENALSFEAMGLLAYLLSKPDNWQVHVQALVRATEGTAQKRGENKILALLRELIGAGYITRKRQSSGKMDYYVYDEPQGEPSADTTPDSGSCAENVSQPIENKPQPSKPHVAKPHVAKPHVAFEGVLINTEGQQELKLNKDGRGANARVRATPPAEPPPDDRPPARQSPPPTKPVAKPARFEPLAALLALGVDAQVAADWLAVRKAKRAALTQTALDDVVSEAGKAGISVAQAVRICAARGWQGFRASWDWRDDRPQGRTFDHGQPALSAGEQARQQALRIAEKMGLTPEQVGIYDANQ